MTVKVLDYSGDGAYYLSDPAHELDGLRHGGPGAVLAGSPGVPVGVALRRALATPRPDGRRALDVIVAAPKPVSLLLALEPPEIAREVVALHHRSLNGVLAYLGDEALADGTERAVGAVGFTHGINRLLDPHLHTHVVLSLHDEHGMALDARRVRAHAASADALYLSTLRAGLPAATGRSSWMTATGRMHVDGVDLGLLSALSVPRDRRGRVVRGGAKTHPSAEEVRAHWERAVTGSEPVGDAPIRPANTGSFEEYRFAATLGEGLVGRAHVVRAWAAACRFGQDSTGVLASVSLLAPTLRGAARRPGVVVRDDVGVRSLGPRPVDPPSLSTWLAGREALARHLEAGFGLGRLRDHRGASARERLSLARLDAALADARSLDRTPLRGPSLDRSLS